VGEGCDDWQALATRTARAVREIDPHHAIIIEPAPGGGPESLANLEPVPVPGVVYSVHVYVPHEFTHQGVHSTSTGLKYPGESAYRYLKDCLELFEENGWDWSYHAFREWNGWSVEHGPDRQVTSPSQTQTSREKLLRSWFDRKAKPK